MTRKCEGCHRLAVVPAGRGEVCLGMPKNPDPPCDIFKFCFIEENVGVVREISLRPFELLAMRRLMNEYGDAIIEMVVLSLEREG